MAELTLAQRAALADLLTRCPTPMLAQVDGMAAVMPGQKAIGLRELLAQEVRGRHRQDMVLAPLAPLFKPRADGLPGLSFPESVWKKIWALATRHEPELLEQLDRGDQVSRTVADRLCLSAAMGLRDHPQTIWPETEGEADPAQIEELARCLDLIGIVRRHQSYRADWLRGGSSQATAELKFAVKQAAAIHETAPQTLLEILFAQTVQARFFLRLLTQLVPTPGRESFVTDQDLAVFATRLADGVVRCCQEVMAFDPLQPGADLWELKRPLEWAAEVMTEMDANSLVRPDAASGQALRQARQDVSKALSNIFTRAEDMVTGLLPVESSVLAGRMKRPIPRLDQPLDEQALGQAKILLAVVGLSRGPALVFGREADRRQTSEGLTWRLASWADEAIERVNEGLVQDEDLACRRIGVAADLLALIEAREAARSIRRRLMVIGSHRQDVQDATTGASRLSA